MPRIRLLSPGLVNLIAAGEVIERPASAAKELIENSLDAGATRIEVEAEEGGAKLLRVADDGCGIERDDLALAVRSHATSKLAGPEDLAAIRTLGFRGEALASIGAVAWLRVASSAGGAEAGGEIVVEQGRVGPLRPLPRPRGTTVEVRDLFANVPARRKFLRGARAEFGHLAETVERAALAHPGVAFTLRHDGRESLRLPAAPGRRERAAEVLGDATVGAWRSVLWDEGRGPSTAPVRVEGWVAPADLCATRARDLRLHVNGRPVRDRGLSHAVALGYRERLPRGSYPTGLLFVDLPPESVDVNVHPTKSEVRFRDPGLVHDTVAAAVEAALSGAPGAPEGAVPGSAFVVSRSPSAEPTTTIGRSRTGNEPAAPSLPFAAVPAAGSAFQVLDSFLVEETGGGIEIWDQHALHERLLYDEILGRMAAGPAPRQRLLVPLPLRADRRLAEAADVARERLSQAGLEIEVLPGDVVLVQAVPAGLGDRDPAAYAAGVLADLSSPADGVEGGGDASKDPSRRLAATMACHAAVVAGQRLTAEQIRALLAKRGDRREPLHCPHGRPASFQLAEAEIRRKFCRHEPRRG
ncbi:MAG: DNA mismatch repair endonuclease MutL [Planctomycetales bacterium]|nr:DNA mismatch repair endonuclease MutL [Planctomycetales bacterium]